jgi:hypothetical protein
MTLHRKSKREFCMDAVGLTGDAETTCENLGQWL